MATDLTIKVSLVQVKNNKLIINDKYWLKPTHRRRLTSLGFNLSLILVDELQDSTLNRWRIPFVINHTQDGNPPSVYLMTLDSGDVLLTYQRGKQLHLWLKKCRELYFDSHFGYPPQEIERSWKIRSLQIKLQVQNYYLYYDRNYSEICVTL